MHSWPLVSITSVARTDMTQPLIDKSDKRASQLGFGESQDVAQGLAWLASDAAHKFNGQCLMSNGFRTALWRSPSEEYVKAGQRVISIEELEQYYADLAPIGIYSSRDN